MCCQLTDAEVFEKFARIVAASLRLDAGKITMESNLSDLGAESLDLIEIAMEVESAFSILVPEKNILETASEVFGPSVLEQDGRLTRTGLGLLKRRMPEDVAAILGDDVSVSDMQHYFLNVGAWVRMIRNLAAEVPSSCAECGGSLEALPGAQLKCTVCQKQYAIPDGDDINRRWVEKLYREEYGPARTLSKAAPSGSSLGTGAA